MVKVLVCPDKFKGSLTSMEVCHAIEEGLRSSHRNVYVKKLPLADGGEGTLDLFVKYFKASIVRATVHDPLFRNIVCEYAMSPDGRIAFIEMAKASGLGLLDAKVRNPLYTTSLGTGELIADALMRNVSRVILGIGGSATNDAGIGMAQALGYNFLDAGNEQLKPIGQNLSRLARITRNRDSALLKQTEFIVLSDVQNPLYGVDGAAHVYAPQKGATPEIVEKLEEGLKNFAAVAERDLESKANFPGAGAAGGLGSGARLFLNAKITSGIHYMFDLTDIRQTMQEVDVIITGEGKVDIQSFSGKVTGEVIKLAKQFGKRVILCCGQSELPNEKNKVHGIDTLVSLTEDGTPESTARAHAAELLAKKISTVDLD